MSLQDVFNIAVVIFTVSNIGAMGLGLNLRETLKDLRSIRTIGLDPLLGLGGRTGAGLAHQQSPSTQRRARGRVASDQPGTDRAILSSLLVDKQAIPFYPEVRP